MEKLELSHLSPYLPYALKWHIEDLYGEVYIDEMNGVFEDLITMKDFGDWWISESNEQDYLAKPILRPLSDMTKEILRNGEKFVPMVELYKISRGRYKDSIVKYWEVMSTKSIRIEMEGHHNYIFSLVYSDCDVRLGIGLNFQLYSTDLHNDNPNNVMVQCWNILLEKLLKWHFDVFGLIEKGLAIDINTLDNGRG